MSIHIFFYKQKTAYEMRISDWSSDVCSSDLVEAGLQGNGRGICRAAGHQDVGRNARARQVTSHDGCMRFQSGFRSAVTDHAGTQHVVEACRDVNDAAPLAPHHFRRSEEHTAELQSLMRSSYAVFCLKNKTK